MFKLLFLIFFMISIHVVGSSAQPYVDNSSIHEVEKNEKFEEILNEKFSKHWEKYKSEMLALQKRVKILEMKDRTQKTEAESLQTQVQALQKNLSDSEDNSHDSKVYLSSNGKKGESDKRKGIFQHVFEELVESKKEENQTRVRRSLMEIPVAFFATISADLRHTGIGQTIIFDNVITNVGNAYHNSAGTFVAPVSGVYVFSTSLFSVRGVSYHASLVRNGQRIATMYIAGTEATYDTSSHTAVLYLRTDDTVFVQHNDVDRAIHGADHSVFSGFLLQQYQ